MNATCASPLGCRTCVASAAQFVVQPLGWALFGSETPIRSFEVHFADSDARASEDCLRFGGFFGALLAYAQLGRLRCLPLGVSAVTRAGHSAAHFAQTQVSFVEGEMHIVGLFARHCVAGRCIRGGCELLPVLRAVDNQPLGLAKPC